MKDHTNTMDIHTKILADRLVGLASEYIGENGEELESSGWGVVVIDAFGSSLCHCVGVIAGELVPESDHDDFRREIASRMIDAIYGTVGSD